ncbi:pre-toxin TG domain-containing protein [Fictibacillus enclensis]|uniref:pre-toxin TG domain-containing protein n=1 Tax=Fictibacillus enclensis TaxID=1017270 RepID=UPI0025A27D3C|nr:pre-toxin TG domain-containing protein [Fictibacillus enclensis]MDM5200696.1 pre-toxin TG domain-containing protein [Fictibacillus enclensis]
MSRISVNPDELEDLAADLQKLEDQCDDIKDKLKWNYNLLHATYWDVDSTSAGGLYHSLVQKLEHYQTLMNNAQAVVKRTEAQFREADQGWFDKAKEWGMELVGVNDVVRIFAEYDPVTGEKLDGWDRLQATGRTALTIFPPAKLAGLGGKAIIKGAKVLKMGDKATEAFRGMLKVLHPDVIKNAFHNALKGVMNLPIFPNFSPARALAGVPGSGFGLHMDGAYKVKDLGIYFSKIAEEGTSVGTRKSNLYRGDSLLHSPRRPNGIGKPHISESGNLVPANKAGMYKGRQVTVTEHILGGFRKGAKSNSPYTSFTVNRKVVEGYGDNTIELNLPELRKAIQSGEVKDVAILSQKKIKKLIERDNTSDFWKSKALSWTARDNEYLVRGEVPSKFIKITSKE